MKKMYKTVIGLEVHLELKTKSKNFSPAENSYSSSPNSNVSVIDLGYPGILPTINKEGVKNALKVALALNCNIPSYLSFDRKNYFYPDLPKGYQITQLNNPIGTNGYVMINIDGQDKKILIHDTHLEEDTASLDHYDTYSLLDYNRCGVPLLETVTEPCIYSAEEAVAFLETYKNIALYLGVSDARNDLGQVRCDVNVSLMKEGSTTLGTRVEMKNIPSFAAVKASIIAEVKRQTKILEEGGTIEMETRRYDEATDMTYPLRKKVEAVDYKYYNESNIPRIKLTKDFIETIKKSLPLLAYNRANKYVNEYNISRKDANTLTRDKKLSDYFDKVLDGKISPITASNYVLNILVGNINKLCLEIDKIKITPEELRGLITKVEQGNISIKQAKEVINESLEKDIAPSIIIKEKNIMQITNEEELTNVVNKILDTNPNLVTDYHNGKRVFDYLIGQIMKETKGKANPSISSNILKQELERRMN